MILSVLLAAGVFAFLARYTSPGDVLRIVRAADRRGIAAFVLLSLVMSILRTWRYALFLETSGHRPPPVPLFLVVLVRNFLSDLLPARLGTLSYVYLATSRLGIPLSGSASSFALSFLFDIAALVPMIAAAALMAAAASLEWDMTRVTLFAALLAVCAGLAISLLPALLRLGGWFIDSLPFPGEAWRSRGREFMEGVGRDVKAAREAGVFFKIFLISVLVRLAKYGSLTALLYALLRGSGFGKAVLPPSKVFLGLVSSELAASLPVSGIGGFGAYEGTWSVVFTILGMPAGLAVTTGISHHLFTQVYGYSLGALAILILLAVPIRKQ
jgi:uncharacterized membrane protein YbhN (UPF0104 family)